MDSGGMDMVDPGVRVGKLLGLLRIGMGWLVVLGPCRDNLFITLVSSNGAVAHVKGG